ncbi:MAG: TVP38/TMEM64 family protein [Spartobacteria bacterium]
MSKLRTGNYLKIVAGIAGIFGFVILARFFPVLDLIGRLQERVMHWGAWGAICYPILFAACNVLLLPGGVLSIGSGFFFGLWWGFGVVMFGNAIGAAVAFILSRRIGQSWFRKRLSNNATLRALEPAVERESWKIIFLSQLHPLFPTSLLNYFYGLTSVDFWTYMVWVALGRAPGLFLYTYLGTLGQHGVNVAQGKTHLSGLEYWIWGSAFVSMALLVILLGRIAVRALDRASFNHEPLLHIPDSNAERVAHYP